jgi:hypothetical protein
MVTKRTVPLFLHPAVMLVTPVGLLSGLSFLKNEVGLPLLGAFAWGVPAGVAISLPLLRLWLKQLSSLDPAQCHRWDLGGSFIPLQLRWLATGVLFVTLCGVVGAGRFLALPMEAVFSAWCGGVSGWVITWWVGHFIWWRHLPPE